MDHILGDSELHDRFAACVEVLFHVAQCAPRPALIQDLARISGRTVPVLRRCCMLLAGDGMLEKANGNSSSWRLLKPVAEVTLADVFRCAIAAQRQERAPESFAGANLPDGIGIFLMQAMLEVDGLIYRHLQAFSLVHLRKSKMPEYRMKLLRKRKQPPNRENTMNTTALNHPSDLVNLEGKVALITGAASGIGLAQVELFLAAGARVIAVDIDNDGLGRLRTTAPDDASRLLCVTADLTDHVHISRAVKAGINAFGQIDILCNTAGSLDGYTRSLETSEALWDRVFDINVKAVYRLTNAVLPGMLERGAGIVVNMASIASFKAGGGGAAYTSSKHAIVGFTRQLAGDYGRRGIRVNAICPGMIETAMTRDVVVDQDSALVKALKRVPAGRLGQPEDIARVALFLSGPGAEFIHGTTIVVDGGLLVK